MKIFKYIIFTRIHFLYKNVLIHNVYAIFSLYLTVPIYIYSDSDTRLQKSHILFEIVPISLRADTVRIAFL